MLVNLVGCSLGFFIGVSCNNINSGRMIVQFLQIALLQASGGFVNVNTLHWSIRFLPYISPNRYGNEAFMRLVMSKENEAEFNDMLDLTGYTFGLLICYLVLAGMVMFLFTASCLVVYWRNKAFH